MSQSAIPSSFNIRVYGLLVDSNKRVLLADEFIRGMYVTKFPGGGLEFGEGTRDCLRREFMEETGLTVSVGEHLYTTDYYQQSAFNSNHQIISIYYLVSTNEPVSLATKTTLFDFEPHQTADPKGESEVFRWVELQDLTEESVNLPIDKIAARVFKEKFDRSF